MDQPLRLFGMHRLEWPRRQHLHVDTGTVQAFEMAKGRHFHPGERGMDVFVRHRWAFQTVCAAMGQKVVSEDRQLPRHRHMGVAVDDQVCPPTCPGWLTAFLLRPAPCNRNRFDLAYNPII